MVVRIDGPVFATELGPPPESDTGGLRICFLHGLFGQGKNWTTVGRALAGQARVLLVDLPNHGRSAWTDTVSYPAMAADVAGLLAEVGAGEPFVVVGHSMGGKVAMMLALQHPELVERLCVVDVSPVSYGGPGSLSQGSFGTYVEGMRALDLETLPDRATADRELTPYVPDPTIRGFLLQNLRRSPHGGSGDGPAWQWQMNLGLLGDHLDQIGGWPELEVEPYPGPVLWMSGERSDYVRPEYADAMRTLFPRTQLVTVKGAGHWVHADRPEVFQATLRRFAGL